MLAESLVSGGLYVSSLLQAIPAWEPATLFPTASSMVADVRDKGSHSQQRSAFRAMLPALRREVEMTCLSAAVYHEARGEPLSGQRAVAMVIVNRVRSPSFPHTICGVVFQNAHRPYRCQFSFTCTGIALLPKEKRPWRLAQEIAVSMQNCTPDCRVEAGSEDRSLHAVSAATHYHASYVRPGWARRLHRLGRIGRHIFFTTKGGDQA